MTKDRKSDFHKVQYDPRMSPELNARREFMNETIDKANAAKAELIDYINNNKEEFGIKPNERVTDLRPGPDGDYDKPEMKIEAEEQ
jgi:hypothetical protein